MVISEKEFYRFSGLSGPSHVSVIPAVESGEWAAYTHGTTSRLAILLTEPDSAWLGLVHGLKSIGIFFTVTQTLAFIPNSLVK